MLQPQKNKRHFQLLEVMIAMLLILICVIPSFQIYVNINKQQANVIRVNQRDHLVHLIHADLIEKLYKQMISLDQILARFQAPFEGEELKKKLEEIGYEAVYSLYFLSSEKEIKTAKKFLVELVIQLQDKKQENSFDYTYHIYIDRGERAFKSGPKNSLNSEEKDVPKKEHVTE